MKTGLVLEGGALKGVYTIGVLDTLLKYNIHIDECITTSSSSLFSLKYLSKENDTFNIITNYINKPNLIGLIPYIKEHNIISNKVYDIFINNININNYLNKTTTHYITTTDIITGKPEYIKITNPIKQKELIKASCAMPYISKIIKYNNKLYLDGGITSNIPIYKALEHKLDKIIVVLIESPNYIPKITNKTLTKLLYKQYPNLIKSLNNIDTNYIKTTKLLKKLQKENKILIIRPSKNLKIKRLEKNISKLKDLYYLGVHDTEYNLKYIKDYLSN